MFGQWGFAAPGLHVTVSETCDDRQITLRHGLVTLVNLPRGADGDNIHNTGRAHYRREAYSRPI